MHSYEKKPKPFIKPMKIVNNNIIVNPAVIDKEIILDSKKVFLSVTDVNGVITYCNEEFVELSGFKEWELVGSMHNIVRHRDMPKIIFKLVWNRLQNKDDITAIVKSTTKEGNYYWSILTFEIKEDNFGNITGYKSYRKPISSKAKDTITSLYKRLREIEDKRGIEASEEYLIGFLEGRETMYDTFIEELIEQKNTPKHVYQEVKKRRNRVGFLGLF